MADIFGSVGSLLRNLGQAAKPYLKPSSAFSRIPGPRLAPSLVTPTSTAGSIFGLLQLQGSTPQDQPKSREWMTKLGELTGQYGRYAPATYRYQYNLEGTAPPGSVPPAPDLNASLFGGPQAGQLTPPVPPLTGNRVMSNGAGVPAQRQNVKERQLSQDVLNAAQQYAAPAGVPLSSFYAGQQQLGRSMEQGGELQRRLKELGGSAGMSDKALMDWAKQNPGLAYRELLKLQNRNQQI